MTWKEYPGFSYNHKGPYVGKREVQGWRTDEENVMSEAESERES